MRPKRFASGMFILLTLMGFLAAPYILWAQEDLAPKVENGRVLFSCRAPDAGAVYLAGTFNGWNAQADPKERDADGVWRLSLLSD